MNKDKWKDRDVPFGVLVAKLSEETGEVAADYSDLFFFMRGGYTDADIQDKVENLKMELKQVKFIANQLLARLANGSKDIARDWA